MCGRDQKGTRGLETEPGSTPEAKEAGDRGGLRALCGDIGIRVECGVLLSIKLLSGVIKASLLGTYAIHKEFLL